MNKLLLLSIITSACSLTCNAQVNTDNEQANTDNVKVTTGSAQAKLDLQSRLTLLKRQLSVALPNGEGTAGNAKSLVASQNSHILSFIKLNGEDAQSELEAEGVKVLKVRNGIAIASIPASEVERIASLECVKKLELPRHLNQYMDRARKVTGVDDIHNGVDLPQAYTGKGVVCGIVDNGFDPNHVNFLKDDGSTRFGYMSKITYNSSSSTGCLYENYYPKAELADNEEANTYAIEDFKTDDKTDYHGTHTLGIMAGGYKGKTTIATPNEGETAATISTVDNPYDGCATDAELVASCGDLDETYILYGLDDIVTYAQYSNGVAENDKPVKEKPCVINMSIGTTLGPHDKNSIMNQYLAEVGKYAIVCLAAGNNADYPICLHKPFTSTDSTLQSFIKPMYAGAQSTSVGTVHNFRYGTFYAYSNDDKEFEIQIVVYNKKRKKIAKRFAVSTNTEGSYNVYVSSTDYYSEGTVDASFAKAFDGYIAIATQYDDEVGKYCAAVDVYTSDNQTTNADETYTLGVVINGHEGQKIDVYSDGQYVYFDGDSQDGWDNGTADGSVSDYTTADNMIVVGSYNTRQTWGCLDGTNDSYNVPFPEGEVTSFSAYATLSNGNTLPHVCAPGASVIASTNRYMVENSSMGMTNKDIQGLSTVNGKKYYWEECIGTSMASPLVAGAIALWLEADPTLKCADIIDIIKKTAKVDDYVKKGNPVQWGAGKFDAYAGLKEVLARKADGIQVVNADMAEKHVLMNSVGQKAFRVYEQGASCMNISIYNANGQKVYSSAVSGNEALVNASNLNKGVYVVKVNNAKGERIVIKE